MSKNSTMESEQLTDSMYYILLALMQKRHGYAIMKFIEELSGGSMTIGPGTLYTLLKKLSKAQWIVQSDDDAERAKPYLITKEGEIMLERELARRKRMVEDGMRIMMERKKENER